MGMVTIVEVDGELLLPIPPAILDRMKLAEGDVLEIIPVQKNLMLRPVKES